MHELLISIKRRLIEAAFSFLVAIIYMAFTKSRKVGIKAI